MPFLDKINKPDDLKQLSEEELVSLADEIRETILSVVSKNGGHLAPNLGVVELTIALHLAIDSPKDKIIWDVGHQAYTHKLLTGRKKEFPSIRTLNGLSGFPNPKESEHDVCITGHASTSVGMALGLAAARDLSGGDNTVVAVIGDGSLTGGLAYEALNQAGQLKKDLIVILNDNEMSIDTNVGAMSAYLDRIRLDPGIKNFREEIEHKIERVPGIGRFLVNVGENIKESVKHLFVPGLLFEELGFRYVGPINGHNIKEIERDITLAKQVGGPVLIHVVTKKGKGYEIAEEKPDIFHGTGAFNIKTGKPTSKITTTTYTKAFGEALLELAKKDERIIGVTAAMANGTGMDIMQKKFPGRVFDVGIAEQQAVVMSAGLAIGGFLPVVAIYSTFLQRAYDQLIHDIALQGLHVIFAIDRAGLVGEDGPTHHGVFDMSYLKTIPGMTIMCPSDENELRHMLFTATKLSGPVAIRYPRAHGVGAETEEFQLLESGRSRVVQSGGDIAVMAVGRLLHKAIEAGRLLEKNEGISCTIIDPRFVKPFDTELIASLAGDHHTLVVIEESTVQGGFSESVNRFITENALDLKFKSICLPDQFVEHGPCDILFEKLGFDGKGLYKKLSAVNPIKQLKNREPLDLPTINTI